LRLKKMAKYIFERNGFKDCVFKITKISLFY